MIILSCYRKDLCTTESEAGENKTDRNTKSRLETVSGAESEWLLLKRKNLFAKEMRSLEQMKK